MKPIALALAQQARGGHRMGAHTVACDEAGGVGGAPQKHRPMIATLVASLEKEEPMTPRAERESVTPRPSLIVIYEVIGFLAIIALSWLNELLGLPRLLLGSEHQGGWWHESLLETTIILVVAVPVVLLTRGLATRLHYLEEFLRLCAWCRKLDLDKLCWLDRLRDEADAPGSDECIRLVACSRGQSHHRDAPGHCVGLEALNDRQTVYSRHMVVEQDQIRPLRPRLRETLTATQGREGTMTLLRKQFGGHLENQRVVVDDEDCKGHRVLSSIAQRRAGVQHRTASS